MSFCPVCRGNDLASSIKRHALPVLQNRVYATREDAVRSPQAPFCLATCRTCGFSFNGAFDPTLVVYDSAYDNDVPSPAFFRYYETLAAAYIERFQLKSGTVVDVGCGKGAFLQTLCRLAPGIEGVGIDPSCAPGTRGNCTFIQDFFQPHHFGADTKLVVLRHVLEHLADPVSFMQILREASPRAPLIVEVPDIDWILRNNAFWDFCYEHSNYFSASSLKYAARRSGYSIQYHEYSFGGQYQWIIGIPSAANEAAPLPAEVDAALSAVSSYANRETRRLEEARSRLDAYGSTALWGMSTKGVVFSAMMATDKIVGGVDVNPKKQGRFAPGSGLSINPPGWLQALDPSPQVLVMNENYLAEIRETVAQLGLRVTIETV